jgi:hypothetical protein
MNHELTSRGKWSVDMSDQKLCYCTRMLQFLKFHNELSVNLVYVITVVSALYKKILQESMKA